MSRSATRAASSAPSAWTETKACTAWSTFSIRSRQAWVSSTGETARDLTALAASANDRQGHSAALISRLPGVDVKAEDRLDVVGQVQITKRLDVLHHPLEDRRDLLEIRFWQRVAGQFGHVLERRQRHQYHPLVVWAPSISSSTSVRRSRSTRL